MGCDGGGVKQYPCDVERDKVGVALDVALLA